MLMQNLYGKFAKWVGIVALILVAPLLATLFSTEVNWDVSDFLIMGAVLFGIGVVYELIAGKSDKTVYKAAFAVGLLGAFLLFWVNGAVGIIGNEGQDANLLYGAVFIVGLIGSLIARFKARGMFYTLIAAAITQMLAPFAAYIIWTPPTISWSPSVFGVFFMSGFFALLFVVSAMLFRRASKD
ncbi:MAG: hypothetical protein KJP00_08430 [Bacteroidia bacterium]|nr:hypothetical protein [Bacteroidia bacterium]